MKKILLSSIFALLISSGFATIIVVTTNSSTGNGSLYQAFNDANGNSNLDTIVFNIAGTPPFKIKPLGTLFIDYPVFIDGTTQPGYNTTTREPIIEIDGSSVAGGNEGIQLNGISSGSHLHGLIINRFPENTIKVLSDNNQFTNLWLGLDSTGTAGTLNGFSGINILYGKNNMIGGNTPAQRNVISGFSASSKAGVRIDGNGPMLNNMIVGNFIGTDKTGMNAIPNFYGIYLNAAKGNQIGNPSARNIISGNNYHGIALYQSDSNIIQNNYVGMMVNGMDSLPNVQRALDLNASSGNMIGGVSPNQKNVFSGNASGGIGLQFNSNNNIVHGNFIGTTKDGLSIKPNINSGGISIYLSKHNIIGGNNQAQRNIISGNGQYDVWIEDADSNTVSGNYIGIDSTGNVGFNVSNSGIYIANCDNNLIGGSTPDERNVISGHINNRGINIGALANSNQICGNYIGTNAAGTAAIPNQYGVQFNGNSNNNIIGGFSTSEKNIISGNTATGVEIGGIGAGNKLYNNSIGTDVTGTVVIPNQIGVVVSSKFNDIGHEGGSRRNLISGNTTSGIFIQADSVEVFGNDIGISSAGNPLGNGANGIMVNSGRNIMIGKGVVSSGNIIACNGQGGVFIDNSNSSTSACILNNRIYSNDALGIELYTGSLGPNPNDSLDTDTGINDLQNFPYVGCIDFDGTNTNINVSLNSVPNRGYYLEVVKSEDPDNTSGYGEGKYIVDHIFVHTGSDGNATHTFQLLGNYTNFFFAATATDSILLITSEYSPAVRTLVKTMVSSNPNCFGLQNGVLEVHALGGFPPYTFSWNNTIRDSIFNGAGAGQQILTLSSSNGCIVIDTLTLVDPAPITIDAGLDTAICLGDVGKTFALGGVWASVSWSPITGLSNPNSPNTFANPTSNTNYIVTGTDVSGCVAIDTALIIVNILPTISVGADLGVCTGNSVNPFYTTNANYLSYNTTVGVNDSTISTPSISPTSTTLYIVTAHFSGNNCVAKDTLLITVNPLPNLVPPIDDSLCLGVDEMVSVSGGISYSWSPTTYLSNAFNPSPIVNLLATTTYQVFVQDANSCMTSDSITLYAVAPPTTSFSSNNICFGETSVFSNTSTLGNGYIANNYWNFGNGATSSAQSPSYNYIVPGTYNVSLIAVSNNNCIDTAFNTIIVNPTTLVGNTSISSLPINSSQVDIYLSNGSIVGSTATGYSDISGNYIINNIPNGEYLVLAHADRNAYPDAIPTYAGNTHNWASSNLWTANCANNDTINFSIINFIPPTLPGATVGGYVLDDSDTSTSIRGGIRKPGEPIKGVGVIIQRRPGGSATYRTTTDSLTGYYEFGNVDTGNYDMVVEMPNGVMLNTHEFTIADSSQIYVEQNFYVDSISGKIDTTNTHNPDSVFTISIYKENKIIQYQTRIYPNPILDEFNLEINSANIKQFSWFISDVQGKIISSSKNEIILENGDRFSIDKLKHEPKGIYYLTIVVEKNKRVFRLIKE